MKAFKGRYFVALLVCVGAVIWMITNLGSNLNYMESVSTAVKLHAKDGSAPNKVGGVVKPKTIDKAAQNGATFEITDGIQTVTARVLETPPAMFADCIAVVLADARWEGDVLVGSRVEVRHGATYNSSTKMKTNVDAALDATGCPKTSESTK
jgi:cytochrome c-type biogenesis protein CcmE